MRRPATPLARYSAMWKTRFASGSATDQELHHAPGHDPPRRYAASQKELRRRIPSVRFYPLALRLDYIRIGDVRVHLRANKAAEGKSGVATTVVLSLLITPLFLMHHGADIVFPRGQTIMAYVTRTRPFHCRFRRRRLTEGRFKPGASARQMVGKRSVRRSGAGPEHGLHCDRAARSTPARDEIQDPEMSFQNLARNGPPSVPRDPLALVDERLIESRRLVFNSGLVSIDDPGIVALHEGYDDLVKVFAKAAPDAV